MKRLSHLHEEFINKARRPMSFGNLPISPIEGDVAIIPVNKWVVTKDPARMRKSFQFMEQESRNSFVKDLLDYESEVGHNAIMTIEKEEVMLVLYTHDINQVTELDKEYALHADELFKDIVYSLKHD